MGVEWAVRRDSKALLEHLGRVDQWRQVAPVRREVIVVAEGQLRPEKGMALLDCPQEPRE